MKASFDQLSPTNRYYLGKLLKKVSSDGDADFLDMQQIDLSNTDLAQLEHLLYFHQSIINQHASSQSNLDHVTSLILALLNLKGQPIQQNDGFGSQPFDGDLEDLVDVPALKQMPLAELEIIIETLRQGLEVMSHFVNEQEDELRSQQQVVAELEQKLKSCSEYECLLVGVERESEQQNCHFLNEALKGQRKRVEGQQLLLQAHQRILRNRQES
ncbi:MAG: hypothetical protein KME35_06570 [Aphanocapsa sp. GSE-SYN-MK-11-07L]|jgi:hypothetical protein|nr:hypothetical protein [Aphanocapsa sp. GSE-SYN-MK-11-07L]